jgi:hypothetical protein
MKLARVEGVYAPIKVAIGPDEGPRLPMDSAISIRDEVGYLSRRERRTLAVKLLEGLVDEPLLTYIAKHPR